MDFNEIVIAAPRVRSLCWDGDELVDWVDGGTRYSLDGTKVPRHVNYAYKFDAAVLSPSGRYAAIYERFGTKGLLLDQGKIVREINRSYYYANAYEYPITLFSLPDAVEAIAHCPDEYCVPEIEIIESGERLTSRTNDKPADFLFSRFNISPNGRYLLSAGWCWHPFSMARLYCIEDALSDPLLLDKWDREFPNDGGVEIDNACFGPDNILVVAAALDAGDLGDDDDEYQFRRKPGSISVFDLNAKSYISTANLEHEAGTVMSVNADYVIGFYEHPKLIDLRSGNTEYLWDKLDSGKQKSSIHWGNVVPVLAVDPLRQRFAIADDKNITVIQFAENKATA